MKHDLKTIMFLVSFAILTIVASESETRLNSKVETEPCMPLRCHNNTYTAAGEFDREESAANATRQEARVPKIYGTDLASRNISVSNVLDILYSKLQNYSKYQNNYTNDTESEIQNDCINHTEVESQLVYFSGMLVSLPFLIATYIVYWLLPELRNIHGQTLLPHVGCLIVAYGTLGATGVKLVPIKEVYFFCIIIALIAVFTWAASFFWLNVMCFDIWWTLRKFRPVHENTEQENRKKFVIYSICAWGGALILTSVSAIMDFVPDIPKTWIRPKFCFRSVWFHTDLAEKLYFWGPISITIIFNIGLFISTAQHIMHHHKNTTHYLKSSQSRCYVKNNYRERFSVYLKLFVVMGMSWSLEILELIIDYTVTCVPIHYCYLTGLTNILQGIVIFILFVFTKKTKNLLRQRLRRRFHPRRNSDLSSVSRITTLEIIPLQDVNLRSET